MGKRSSFERIPRDFYPTPYAAVVPLLPHLYPESIYIEPCAGDGALLTPLQEAGHKCVGMFDIESPLEAVKYADARSHAYGWADMFITNPPWTREVLHPIILNLSAQKPTWLLFDADWMHTKQSAEPMRHCHKIVSVGRVKWIPDSTMTGKDNCCWYLFDQTREAPAQFIGRAA